MKKIYLSLLSMAIVSGVSTQVYAQNIKAMKMSSNTELSPERKTSYADKAAPLWSNTFANPADWVIANDGVSPLNWQIGVVSNTGNYPTGDIESTTAADGYAMLDSDANAGSDPEDAWLTNANGIDLTGYPNVVVEFENNYRRWDSKIFLVVGIGDGAGNVTWPDLDFAFDASTDPTVFEVFPQYATNNDASTNPELAQINISAALAGQPLNDIYIRFNWTGTYGYSWFVDDVNIVEQPADDIQLLSSWVVGDNNEGIEYGRTPVSQLDASWTIGSEVYNFGTNDQTSIEVDADFTSFSSALAINSIVSGASEILENTETPTLTTGLYEGVYTATSAGETMGANFGNNTLLRNFEVTDDIYSTDGIDVHPAADLSLAALGTTSFTGVEDGLVLANKYHIKTASMFSGMRIMLASGTVEGGEIYAKVIDTASFMSADMTPLHIAQPVYVTATDITNGYVDIFFPSVISLTPNAYMFAIELFSNANTTDIRVLDDATVAQPFDASMIYIPNDAVYSNGEALGIRLLMGDTWGVGLSESSIEGVSVYPNPSEGIVNITNDNNTENTIEVYDLVGKSILSTTVSSATSIDLSTNGTGVYVVKVSNENGSLVERVVIK